MRDTKLIVVLLAALTFVVVGFVLRLLEPILLPLVVAAFLAQIFRPLMKALRRRRVPAAIAILLVLVVVSVVLVAFAWVLYVSSQSFIDAVPAYQARLTHLLGTVQQRLMAEFPRLRGPLGHWQDSLELSSFAGVVAAGLGSFLIFFNDLFLILLFMVFLLMGSQGFPEKLRRAFPARYAEQAGTVTHNIEEQVRRYLLMKTLVNLGIGGLVALLLSLFGVDFPLFWGFVAFLAHYIPSIGAIISVALPTVFFFLQFSPGTALLVTLLNLGLQFFLGNVAEPRFMGTSLDLSPLLVLLSLIFWGWLWGVWGMVLAVPITSTLKIICENVPALAPLAILMSGSPHVPPAAAVEAPRPAPAS